MSHSIETRCVHGEEHKFKDEFQSLSTPIYPYEFAAVELTMKEKNCD